MLVAVVPALALQLQAARSERQRLLRDARETAHTRALLVAEQQQRAVDGIHGLLLAISRMAEVRARSPACNASLAPLLEAAPAYANVGAVLPSGQVFCTAFPAARPTNLGDRAFMRRAIETGRFASGGYTVSRLRGVLTMPFGQPVWGDRGELAAVAFASLDLAALQRQLEGLPLPPGVTVAVMDREGVQLAVRPAAQGQAGTPFDPALLARLAARTDPLDLAGPDGVERIYASAPVATSVGELAMRVVVGVPSADIYGHVNEAVRRNLLALGLVSLLALGGAVLAGEHLLVRRIRALIAAAGRIARGDEGARSGLRAGEDELGQLVRAFDGMAESLQALARQREQLEEQLRQGQKMKALGQLAGGVAHDFNNLLTAILACGRFLQERLPPGAPGRDDADAIVAAGERAAALTRQLLALARRQRLAPRFITLADAVRSLEQMLARVLGEEIEVVVEVRAPGPVEADPAQLELLLLNLALNARDAMPGGGRLTLTVDERDGGRSGGPGLPAGPLSALSVRDTGGGIAPEVMEHLFEPFFTTKPPGKGTGLGLATVYGFVTQSGGTIQARSAPGQGTEFVALFPRRAPALAASPAAPAKAASTRGSETVLLVEDDDAVRGIARRALKRAGYQVLDAASPSAALAASRGHPGPIALLVSDVLLPERNGWELSRTLVAERDGLRVLFMSGYAGDRLDGTQLLPPGVPLVPKPFTAEELLARVRAAIDGR
ncbi:ATP-binding protein [Anaeromyxobacter paludicola]|uniref:histidine kinase n=1 Tax=Anaeromyxobacter paludicola TaxID=2918171 RepID=A0ABM7XBU9_9BACT|nr:ATP-binding protein [Anaeromyxobacter paludicola]BDG09337.1 histidine kinase [Anaeromyxobacter paludicola]